MLLRPLHVAFTNSGKKKSSFQCLSPRLSHWLQPPRRPIRPLLLLFHLRYSFQCTFTHLFLLPSLHPPISLRLFFLQASPPPTVCCSQLHGKVTKQRSFLPRRAVGALGGDAARLGLVFVVVKQMSHSCVKHTNTVAGLR